ncbi:UNVERIFIED_CONTAM: hypothetical protein FKN15_053721 [Acipenser sinensis]
MLSSLVSALHATYYKPYIGGFPAIWKNPVSQEYSGAVVVLMLSLQNKGSLLSVERVCRRCEVCHQRNIRVINTSDVKADLVESCLEETGGLGVDIVIDAGVRIYSTEDESTSKKLLPHKHDIITLLAVSGHWVTTEENLQMDPPDSRSLFLKGATMSFLNDEVWNMSSTHQGKYLRILSWYTDINSVPEGFKDPVHTGILILSVTNACIAQIRPQLDNPVPLYEATVSMEMVQKKQVRKRHVIQL